MRLIDADALEQKMAGPFVTTYKEARQAVKDAPTMDAVQVVLCKDCKFMEHAINGKGVHGYCCNNSDSPVDNNRWIDPDWYCADGERREE